MTTATCTKPASKHAFDLRRANGGGRRLVIGGALAIALAAISGEAYGAEARSSAVTTYGDCNGSQRDHWDDMCMTWRKRLGSKGWGTWWRNYDRVIVDRYADPAINAWGIDNSVASGFDGGQAALLCTHGGRTPSGWVGLMHHRSQGECGADVNQWKPGIASGGATRYLQLSSCNSMRWDKVNTWFAPAAGGVHVVTGFHGLMYIGSGYVDEYEDQVDDSYSGQSVAESWVDNMYHDPIIGPTICPVAMAFGSSKNAALNRLVSERYKTPTGEMAGNYGVLMWISGCDPDDANALPQ